jgi:hypothetical protein
MMQEQRECKLTMGDNVRTVFKRLGIKGLLVKRRQILMCFLAGGAATAVAALKISQYIKSRPQAGDVTLVSDPNSDHFVYRDGWLVKVH